MLTLLMAEIRLYTSCQCCQLWCKSFSLRDHPLLRFNTIRKAKKKYVLHFTAHKDGYAQTNGIMEPCIFEY